jgi:hypothetical protein
MPINSLLYPSNVFVPTAYNVANSLRFNSGSSDYLNRTLGTPTLATKNTFSVWYKKSKVGTEESIIFANGNAGGINPRADDKIQFYNAGGTLRTDRLFRDTSAWYNLVVVTDTTLNTANDRLKMYINGVQETSFTTRTNPSQNAASNLGTATAHVIGCNNNPANYFNGYMAEVCFIDGQALDPTSFGEFDSDSGIWRPISVSGLTFGNNGFYLEFGNSGALGTDSSGEGNTFTVNNLAAIDQTTDTCTNNFATLNPLNQTVSGGVFSEGNLIFTRGGNALSSVSTFAITTGKWYWEWKQLGGNTKVGIGSIDTFTTKASSNAGTSVVTNAGGAHTGGLNTYAYSKNGKSFSQTKDGNNSGVTYGNTWTTNDIIGCAFDATNGTIWFSKNGTWQDSATITEIQNGTTTNAAYSSIASDTFYVIQDGEEAAGVGHSIAVNFGSPPYTISSGNTDGNGYGNFEYAVPSGYYALNTKNLSEYG